MSDPRGPEARPDASILLRHAIDLRNAWLGHALSTLPADRPAAEAAISDLYRLIGKPPPRFVWVESPAAALAAARPRGAPRLNHRTLPALAADWPVASQLATLISTFRSRLDRRIQRRLSAARLVGEDPRTLVHSQPPQEALRLGVRLEHVVDATVWESLEVSVHDAVAAPLRTERQRPSDDQTPLTWYGQHDAHWIARYEAWLRLGLVRASPQERHQLGVWSALARSCGWWSPSDDTCVVSERPVAVHTEPTPGGVHGQRRLHREDGMAVRYADGWGLYVLHGTVVPVWVVTEPTPERITAERNIEIRRAAIERIGWDAYITQAGLDLVAVAPDPGNPGCDLHLYDLPEEARGPRARILLAVNGSVERDGHRRRYGLTVPADLDDPVAAAGWSYGLSGDLYARLLRRT
ncbi:MAG TPA: hypothetical protein VHJ17_24500 [Thermomonospora sp.]|nr:hypothetical protein [Thermomonospora sp.]